MPEIQKVSVRHDAIMDYMLSNPMMKLGEVARVFDVSQPWLSCIIHSDAFQIQLSEKKSGVFNATVLPLREKLNGVAHLAVEKLGDVLENASVVNDKQFIADTTDSILKNLGYSPKSVPPSIAGNVQNQNVFVVDREALAAARDKMRGLPIVEAREKLLGSSGEVSTSEGVQASGGSGGGEVLEGTATVCETAAEEGKTG